MPPDDIESLRSAIKTTHGCEAHHLKSVPVHAVFLGQTTWKGTVEVFCLTRHPKAKRCYAWSYQVGQETRSMTVLEIPPVDSPEAAARGAIASNADTSKMADVLFANMRQLSEGKRSGVEPGQRLSAREREIVQLVAEGKATRKWRTRSASASALRKLIALVFCGNYAWTRSRVSFATLFAIR